MPATNEEPEVRLSVILPTDIEWHRKAIAALSKMPSFWEDRMLVNPTATYMRIFCNPDNLVLDIAGDGLMAFERSGNGICAWLYGASWGPESMRATRARSTAYATALLGLGVHRIIGITSESNTLAKKAMDTSGMYYRGRLPKALWYNGECVDGVWYELSREDLNLPPV